MDKKIIIFSILAALIAISIFIFGYSMFWDKEKCKEKYVEKNENNYVTWDQSGRLGNHFFGIYTALSYSFKHNKKAIFHKKAEFEKYWNTVFKNLDTYSSDSPDWKITIPENSDGTYENKKDKDIGNIIFKGYFQNYNNFFNDIEKINKILEIEKFQDDVKKKYQALVNDKYIGVHFRLGDYNHGTQIHNILDNLYYEKALNKIDLHGKEILVFTGKEDYGEAENKLKDILKNIGKSSVPFRFTNIDNELDEMFLMSLCKTLVIANSTFSWWAAVFSGHKNIYLPKFKWYENSKDRLILPGWNLIEL